MNNKIIYKRDRFKYEAVLRNKKISSGAKLVLQNLLFRAGIKNYCFPSQKKIGFDIGLSDRQVRNHLTVLSRKEIVTWIKGAENPEKGNRFNSNKYDLSNIMRRIEQ